MNSPYVTPVVHLTTEQLESLSKEIESSGVLQHGKYDYDKEDWRYHAWQRWAEMADELNYRQRSHKNEH